MDTNTLESLSLLPVKQESSESKAFWCEAIDFAEGRPPTFDDECSDANCNCGCDGE